MIYVIEKLNSEMIKILLRSYLDLSASKKKVKEDAVEEPREEQKGNPHPAVRLCRYSGLGL